MPRANPNKRTAAATAGAAPAKKKKQEKQEKQDTVSSPAKDQVSWYLMKSEPDECSIDHLQAKDNSTDCWTGVRNAQARNIMKGMRLGDQILFYHSSCKEPGIAGIAEVVREAYPDHSAWDPASKYHDPSSSQDNPKWWMVDLKFKRKLQRYISLSELKQYKEDSLQGMQLFNRPRLSVQPVSQEHVDYILQLEGQPGARSED